MVTLEQMLEIDFYRQSKIVIWGCKKNGNVLYQMAKELEIEIFSFCDNNPQLWDTSFFDVPVISPKQVEEMEEVLVFVAVDEKYQEEVVSQLEAMGQTLSISAISLKLVLGFYLKEKYALEIEDKKACVTQTNKIKSTVENGLAKKKNFDKLSKDSGCLIYTIEKVGSQTLERTWEVRQIPFVYMCHFAAYLKEKINNT